MEKTQVFIGHTVKKTDLEDFRKIDSRNAVFQDRVKAFDLRGSLGFAFIFNVHINLREKRASE